MTVVTTVSREPEPLSSVEARQLLDDIKIELGGADHDLESASNHWKKAVPLIEKALQGQAWVNAGYATWDACCAAEFSQFRWLARENRAEIVGALSEVGLSQRAIAAATGLSRTTVQREQEESSLSGGPNGPPELAPASEWDDEPGFDPTELVDPPSFIDELADDDDGFAEALAAARAESEADRAMAAELVSSQSAPAPARVTGLDGKSYQSTAPTPAKPRRAPLAETAERAGWDVRKLVERVERIFADDRFGANKDQVAAHLDGHLSYAVEVFQDLLDRLNHQQKKEN